MEKIKTRYLLVIGLLTIFGVMQGSSGYSSYVRGYNENPLKDFPLQVGEWSGKEHQMREKVYEILETDAVILNSYQRGQEYVALSTVFYNSEKVDFHSPESCSLGRGDRVDQKTKKTITLDLGEGRTPITINELIVNRAKGKKDIIYYFFKSGSYRGADYLEFRYHVGLNMLKTRKTNGALIILTTPVIESIAASESTLKSFMESFYSSWTKYL